MKAINPHASLEEPIKEKVEEDGVNPKRKEAIGEDCPVYVPSRSFLLVLPFFVIRIPYWREANVSRCYEEMSDQDVKTGQLVWDESDEGCGKGLSHFENQGKTGQN